MLFVGKLRVFLQPYQIHRSGGTFSLFSYDYLRDTLLVGIRIVIIISVYEHNHIGILLDRSRLSEIRKHRLVIRSLINLSVKL